MPALIKKLTLLGLVILITCGAAQADMLTVGCDLNIKPFVFTDAEGNYTGFDIDIWNAVADAVGLKYKLQPMAFAELLPALQDGRIDAAFGALSITAARERQIDFSYPYYDAGLILMVKKDNPFIRGIEDLDDKVVATKKATTSDEFVHNIQTKAVKLFDTIEAAYAAVRTDEADAVIFDSTVILHFLETDGKSEFKTVGRLYSRQTYGFAFPAGSPLRDKVSIAVLELREGFKYAIIYSKWFGPYRP